jgi:16S rRNA (guanine1516-N2)-methyltransferase
LPLFTAREFILPDMILLDPMFGGERGAAKPSKEIQALAATVGADADADALLDMAIAAATKRVIVKRSRLAPPLAGRAPDWIIKGKLLRFDVYRAGAL